jgi:hypothetical protein
LSFEHWRSCTKKWWGKKKDCSSPVGNKTRSAQLKPGSYNSNPLLLEAQFHITRFKKKKHNHLHGKSILDHFTELKHPPPPKKKYCFMEHECLSRTK